MAAENKPKPHSSSFMYSRPASTEARKTAISRRLFLAQNFRVSALLSSPESHPIGSDDIIPQLQLDDGNVISQDENGLTPRADDTNFLELASTSAEMPIVDENIGSSNNSISAPLDISLRNSSSITSSNGSAEGDVQTPFCDVVSTFLEHPSESPPLCSSPSTLYSSPPPTGLYELLDTVVCDERNTDSPTELDYMCNNLNCISDSDICTSPLSESDINSSVDSRASSVDNLIDCASPLGKNSFGDEDWERIIDNTVSGLTTQCSVASGEANSFLRTSSSIDWINVVSSNYLRPSPSICNIDNFYDGIKNLGTSMELSASECRLAQTDNENDGNGTGSAKSLDSFGCEGNCHATGDDVTLFVVDGKSKMKAATLARLVQQLTCDKHTDPELAATFMLTYRIFSDAAQIFNMLVQRYETSSNNMVRLRICGVLKQWLEKHFTDLENNSGCSGTLLDDLTVFLEQVKLDCPTSAVQLRKIIEKRGLSRATTVSFRSPVPNRPRSNAKFLEFDDLEIARQLALLEFEWFKQILPTECLNKAWVDDRTNAPNICNMINKSNSIPFWVATEIVQRDNLEERVFLIKKFISIADHCRAISNYNGLMEILSGLNMTAIYRLKKTWACLSPRVLNTFQALNQLMSPSSNFKLYREFLRKDTQPRVPYLGRYLTDIVFTEDATPLHLPNGLINYWKCKTITQIVCDLVSHQKQPYMFEEVPVIKNYLQKSKGLTENALLKLSRKLEPKGS